MLPDFSELAERVGPSVVNIRTLERGRQAARGSGEMDPNMEEFFRRFGIPLPGRPAPRPGPRGDEEPQQRGVGSGFVSVSSPQAKSPSESVIATRKPEALIRSPLQPKGRWEGAARAAIRAGR
jgi:S1-C subfamily serine protease